MFNRDNPFRRRTGDDCNCFGLQPHEFPDCGGSVSFGLFLQQASQQDKGDDDACSFEVNVRVNAPFQPEFGEKHVEQAEQVGYPGTVGHQCVHVGAAMFQLFPCTGEEASSQPKDDGSGKQPHGGIGIRHIHEEHADEHDRYGQGDGPCGTEFQCAILFVVRLFHFVRHIFILLYQ